MKTKKLDFKIPAIHMFILMVFVLVVNLTIKYNTQGFNEIYGIVYSIGFFIANPVFSFIMGVILIIPLPLLVLAIIKKRKDLIIGFSISTAISVALLILISTL